MIKRSYLVVASLIIVAFIFTIRQFEQISWNNIPRGDQVAFLETAIKIKETGGVVQLLPNMFRGVYQEANRHPLYVALLSPLAKRDFEFFWQAKILTYLISLGFLGVLTWVMLKQKGYKFALLIALLFATNRYFLEHSSIISTEPLLMIFIVLSWYFIVDSASSPRVVDSVGSPPREGFQTSEKRTFLAGIFTGLAFLSKVTAIFILPAYIFTTIAIKKKKTLNKHLFIFFGAFIVVTFPLLWRNFIVYKNPIYNYNSRVVFIDEGKQRKTLDALGSEAPTALTYFQSHSKSEITKRLILGAIQESVVVSQIIFFSYARIRGSILLVVLLAIALVRDKNRARAIFSLLLILAFYIFFSWFYKISGHYRYVLPIIFIIYFYLLSLVFDFTNWLREKFISVKFPSFSFEVSFIFVSMVMLMNSYLRGGFISPIDSVEPSQEYLWVRDWVQENIKEGERYINGPGHDYQVEWLAGTADQALEMPAFNSFSELEYFLEREKFKYVIITKSSFLGRKKILAEYFDFVRGEDLIIKKEKPIKWKLLLKDQRHPCNFFIFSLKNNE